MINDFTIKACKKKLKDLGYDSFEHFSCQRRGDNGLAHFFKFEHDNQSFYFSFYPKIDEKFDFYKLLVNRIDRIIFTYNEPEPFSGPFSDFVRTQSLCKVCFEGKANFGFPNYRYDRFYRECFNKYVNCKDFMTGIENLDLRVILNASAGS